MKLRIVISFITIVILALAITSLFTMANATLSSMSKYSESSANNVLIEKIQGNSTFLVEIESNPMVRKVLARYNLTIRNREIFITQITPIDGGHYKVSLRVKITPALYLVLDDVVIDESLRVIDVLKEPAFTQIPPPTLRTELDRLFERAREYLIKNRIKAMEKLANDKKVVAVAEAKGIPLELIREYMTFYISSKNCWGRLGVSFNTRTGDFDSYILTVQFVKLKINNREMWVPDYEYVSALRGKDVNKDIANARCLEQVTIHIHFDIVDDTIKVVNVRTIELPVCLVELGTPIKIKIVDNLTS